VIPQAASAQRAAPGRIIPAWFDEDGFLEEPANWTPELAEELAREAGIGELTSKHWEVIELVRGRFFAIGALPVMRLVCRRAGVDPGQAHRLFSGCKSLWRIAGLPNPGEEAKAYMS
jgi:TusE/DsrC/DsvC family sulfur relay protein